MEDSSKSFVTLMLRTPILLIIPAKTVSPSLTVRGTDSPVNADVSTCELPSIISPSKGIFSPGLTTIISPIFTVSGDTFLSSPSIWILA